MEDFFQILSASQNVQTLTKENCFKTDIRLIKTWFMFSKIKQFMCDQHDLNEVIYNVFNNKNCQMASICFMTYFDLTGFYNCYKKLYYPDLPKLIYDQRILNEIILTKLRSKCLSFRNFNFLKLKVKNGATEFSWFQ